jgi:pilus assembly protein CpaE
MRDGLSGGGHLTPQGDEKIRVLIVDDIAETRENLRKLLSFDAAIEVVGAAGSGPEGIELTRQLRPDVVVVDINMPGMDGITATGLILQEVPTAQVVMLSVQGETDYLRRAMMAGARDFLTKPPSGDELMATIRRVYEAGRDRIPLAAAQPTVRAPGAISEPHGPGKMVAVYSPKGGVGCTTIAVNLAVAFQQMSGGRRRVALVDTDLQFGDVGVMLNLQANRSLLDLVDQIEDMDLDMLNSVLTPHGSGIKTLLAPPHPEAAEGLFFGGPQDDSAGGAAAIGGVLNLVIQSFDLVVADTWSRLDDVALAVMDAADVIVLVVTPNIPDIRAARMILEVASKLNYPSDKTTLVVNGGGRRRGIRVDQIERATIPVVATIPWDIEAASDAANQGVPVLVRQPHAPVSQAILKLAEHLHDVLVEETEAEREPEEAAMPQPVSPRRGLGRIFSWGSS